MRCASLPVPAFARCGPIASSSASVRRFSVLCTAHDSQFFLLPILITLSPPGRKAVLGIMSMRRMSTLAQADNKNLSPRAQELATNMHKYMEDAEKVRHPG